jgi:hypothetical protein
MTTIFNYGECCCAECRDLLIIVLKSIYPVCHYAECHYAECFSAL